ncbi:hypothetical protein GCM10010214_49010 [Streptomyces abikoensis]|nr:hypothetical protein GCM10010214_49010 [Streptomyces abikoensis]
MGRQGGIELGQEAEARMGDRRPGATWHKNPVPGDLGYQGAPHGPKVLITLPVALGGRLGLCRGRSVGSLPGACRRLPVRVAAITGPLVGIGG